MAFYSFDLLPNQANPIVDILQNKKINISIAGPVPASPSVCNDISNCKSVSNRIHATYFDAFYCAMAS
jgi:hypothetical protein